MGFLRLHTFVSQTEEPRNSENYKTVLKSRKAIDAWIINLSENQKIKIYVINEYFPYFMANISSHMYIYISFLYHTTTNDVDFIESHGEIVQCLNFYNRFNPSDKLGTKFVILLYIEAVTTTRPYLSIIRWNYHVPHVKTKLTLI